MRRMMLGAAPLVLTLCLAACGGGGGDGAVVEPPTAPGTGPLVGPQYMPLPDDGRWVYRDPLRALEVPPMVAQVNGSQSTAAGFGTVVDTQTVRSIYVTTTTGLRLYGPPSSDPVVQALDGLEVMRWSSQAGDRFALLSRTVDAGADYDGDGRNDRVTIEASLEVIGFEAVTVPAGRFDGCLHQQLVLRYTLRPSGPGDTLVATTRQDTWYATGVGPVRSVTSEEFGGGITRTEQGLEAYRLEAVATDTTGPSVLSVTPTVERMNRWDNLRVSASFDEPIDTDTVDNGLVVIAADGTPVPGRVSLADGRTLHFDVSGSWPEGRITVRAGQGTRDWMGNPTAVPHEWSFEVDGTGPGFVSATPAPGTDDVPLDSSFTIRLSEAPLASTVNETTVRLLDARYQPLAVRVRLDGAVITARPASPLERGSSYTLSLGGLTDAVGNHLTSGSLTLDFRTAQGRFDYPELALPGSSVGMANVIADLDGDGFNDLIVLAAWALPLDSPLYVMPGRADGTLGPARAIDGVSLGICSPEGMVAADLNGDGRPDLAVAGSCGLRVLLQGADGSFAAGPVLAPGGTLLRSADIDGDSRLDLLGAYPGSNRIHVWRQGSDGSLGNASAIELDGSYGRDLRVGDLDGDGRADIVVATSGVPGRHLAVLRQRPDGSFEAPRWLDVGPDGMVLGVGLGDLDGDGRADIAAGHTSGDGVRRLLVFRQQAGGALAGPERRTIADKLGAVVITDIDRDGRADLVASALENGWLNVALQRADGSLGEIERFASMQSFDHPGAVAVGDLNADGWPDVLIEGVLTLQRPEDRMAPGSATRRPPILGSPWLRGLPVR